MEMNDKIQETEQEETVTWGSSLKTPVSCRATVPSGT